MNTVNKYSEAVRGLVAGTASRRGVASNSAFRAPRSAFTLVEMIVSIGILVLMMSMVGTVFQVTTKSTGQARAMMEVSQTVRLLRDTLVQDFNHVNPQRSILVIQANKVNAYWKNEHRELDLDGDPSTGYTHPADPERELSDGTGNMDLPRADVLMFFTSRKQRSVMYPDIWSNIAQIVYGHAEIGELNNAGAWVGGPPAPFPPAGTAFNVAAENWHLARRAVLLVDLPEAAIVTADSTGGLPGSGNDVPTTLDDATDAGGDNLYPGITPLIDGVIDFADNGFVFESEIIGRKDVLAPTNLMAAPWSQRSRIDLQPPAQNASRLGHYFIPKCASFKVEWALDLRKFAIIPFNPNPGLPDSAPNEVIWFDPANPIPLDELNVLAAAYLATGDPNAALVATAINVGPGSLLTLLLNRFDGTLPPLNSGITPQTPVWYANDRVNGGSPGQPDRYYPVALRITVDLYDNARRLERPMRHVIILPIGSG